MQSTTLHKITIVLVCALLSACELGNTENSSVQPNYQLLSACEKTDDANSVSIVEESLCGSIPVYEDREAKNGRKINLNIMLLPATSSVVKPDPLFFLAGGPGQAAVDVGPRLFSRLRDMRRERDIILVDQRGTGESNSLACDLEIDMVESMSLSVKEFTDLQTKALQKCLNNYDANPALYTTPIAMDDLNEVREVLGYDQINLYGISYGTRAALVYLRRHEASVRSIIIDSVVPLTMSIPKNVAVDAQSAFDIVINDCHQQSGCETAFPNLQAHFRELVTKLNEHKTIITVVHPRTGEPMTGPIDPIIISRLIRSVMYNRTLSRLLPFAIEAAYNNNFQPISTLGYAFGGDEGDLGMSMGMMASVMCSEDMTLVNDANHAEDFDNALYDTLKPICAFWPKGEIDDNYFKAVVSNKPVLLTSGKLDPITPPKYGAEAALTLSNSIHVIVPGVGHATSTEGCMPKVLSKFLDNPSPKELDAACTEKLKRPAFFTSLAGPVDDFVTTSEQQKQTTESTKANPHD